MEIPRPYEFMVSDGPLADGAFADHSVRVMDEGHPTFSMLIGDRMTKVGEFVIRKSDGKWLYKGFRKDVLYTKDMLGHVSYVLNCTDGLESWEQFERIMFEGDYNLYLL